jgi:hypothetical protein
MDAKIKFIYEYRKRLIIMRSHLRQSTKKPTLACRDTTGFIVTITREFHDPLLHC